MSWFVLRLAGVLTLLGATCSCESVLSAPDYHTEAGDPVRALATTYASGAGPACVTCLTAGSCGDAFGGCVDLSGCREFTECMVESPSPASEANCVVQLEPSEETREAARALLACHRLCFKECDAGKDFSCVGNYGWLAGLRNSSIRLTQTFSYLQEEDTGRPDTPVVGSEVTICPPGPDCDVPLDIGPSPLVTDENGRYEVDIPISREPSPLAGFRGYRLITGEGHWPHRQQRNTRMVVDITEQTRLLSRATTDRIRGMLMTDPFAGMLLQIFDCRGVGADDVYFKLPNSPEAEVHYKTDVSFYSVSDGPTLASQEGSAAVLNAGAGRWHRVEAWTSSGQLVAESDVYLPGDAIVLAALHPNANR